MRNWINLITETYVPNDLANYASGYMRGMGASNHPDACHTEDHYEWRYEPNYPISNLNPDVDKREWMLEEIEMWAEDGQPDRYQSEINDPIEEPIIVVEIDSVGEIIDGWHRVGGSVLGGRDTIPAVVGVLKAIRESVEDSSKSLQDALYLHIKTQIDSAYTRRDLQDGLRELKKNLYNGMLIYRALGWEDFDSEVHTTDDLIDRVNLDSLGLYWTWDRKSAVVGGVLGGGGGGFNDAHVILTAEISLQDIDMLSTIYQNLTVFEEEKEIRLKPHSNVKIVDISPQPSSTKLPIMGNTGAEGWDTRAGILRDLHRALDQRHTR